MGIRARGLFGSTALKGHAEIFYREQRGLAALFFFMRAVIRLRPDLICVINIGYAGAGCALFFRLISGIPYIIDTGDLLYEMAVLTRKGSRLFRQHLRLCEYAALKLARGIVVRGSAHVSLLRQRGFDNVFFIPDGIWPGHSRPLDATGLRAELGLEDRFVVGVVGSCVWVPALDWAYGLDLVEIMACLKQHPVHGIMIGGGDGLERVRERARQAGVEDRIIFPGHIPYDRLPLWISLFDFAISTQNNTLAAEVRTTGKLPEYLACGRYVIASRVGEAKRLLPPEMLVGYTGCRDYGYGGRVAERIIRVMAERQKPPVDFPEGVDIARAHFDYEMLGKRLREAIQNIDGVSN